MSARVDQFCDTLRDRLNTIEGRIQSVMTNLHGLSGEAEKAVRAKLDEARTKLQAHKERAEKARANLTILAQQKIAETKEAVSEWKTRREIWKLQARAERAEAYAADAVACAAASIDVAEEAILDAMVARIDADAAR